MGREAKGKPEFSCALQTLADLFYSSGDSGGGRFKAGVSITPRIVQNLDITIKTGTHSYIAKRFLHRGTTPANDSI